MVNGWSEASGKGPWVAEKEPLFSLHAMLPRAACHSPRAVAS